MEKLLQLTAVIEREEDGYVATCPELDVVSQGDTVEEARSNLLKAVEGFFEAASPSDPAARRFVIQTPLDNSPTPRYNPPDSVFNPSICRETPLMPTPDAIHQLIDRFRANLDS